MPGHDSYRKVIEETCNLLRDAARRGRRSVTLSPEVAAALEHVATPRERKQKSLDALEREMKQCAACEIAGDRTNLVFGSGNPDAKLVFVGEAPGRDEDMQGKPFVGRAGTLLTDIIEKAMFLGREDVYICNVLKCRPPENRNPLPAEIEKCEPFLIRQLDIIRPRVICALGTIAAQTLLKSNLPVGRLRERWHFYNAIPLRVTYHPAYLLRNPDAKRKTWMDVIEVMKVYNGEANPKPE